MLALFILLPMFCLGLSKVGLRRFHTWLDCFPVSRRSPLNLTEAAALGQSVNCAATCVLGAANCLTRSLLLRWLLHFFGTASDLRIGVRFDNGKFAAHAWIEKDGIHLNDQPEVVSGFAAFYQPVSPKLFT